MFEVYDYLGSFLFEAFLTATAGSITFFVFLLLFAALLRLIK